MIENIKRYYAKGDEYDGEVYDRHTNELICETIGLEYARDICNLLNEQNETIIKLKKENKDLTEYSNELLEYINKGCPKSRRRITSLRPKP